MAEAYPLHWPDGWPRTPWHNQVDARHRWGKGVKGKRRPWTFGEARDELFLELDRFGAESIVLSTNYKLTQAGLPSRNFGAPDDGGVAIYFMLNGKQMVMAQDGYTRAEENLRALSLVLKYLRCIEDMGGGAMMEKAFAGFEALPAPGAQGQKPWRAVFGWESVISTGRHEIERRYRELSKTRHPDTPTGSEENMAELNLARDEALAEINAEAAE